MAIFPLWWSSFSETLGRRTIYLVSFTLFLVFNILAAVSVNISMLIVMRILGGGAAASVQAVGAGTIADVWEVRVRGKAMSIFYLGPLVGMKFPSNTLYSVSMTKDEQDPLLDQSLEEFWPTAWDGGAVSGA